jgi:malonyl-CoA decarboxylase
VNTSFFGEMLQTIAERGRSLLDRTRNGRERRGRETPEQRAASLVELCEELLSGRGEASGVALAREILTRYAELTTGPRIAFFETLAADFGPDHARLDAAIAAWRGPAPGVRAASAGAVSPPQPRAGWDGCTGAHARAAHRRLGSA